MQETARQKAKQAYHHGDLERALVEAAVETIRAEGVEALTLRSVGARLGVSRTALYRHFDDKGALLARVASEGFQLLHETMARAIANSSAERGDTLRVMAAAHVLFAVANPSHYQTMFGGHLTDRSRYPELVQQAQAALAQVADAVREAQRLEQIGPGDPVELAEIFWSLSHGIATLGASGHLPQTSTSVEELAVLGCGFLEGGMRLAL
jgi:AcrR family transcriptional regulator